MNKIMFNDRYGLTQAVINGRKTMTRRICKEQHWSFSDIVAAKNGIFHFEKPKYKIGEIVAVAHSYDDLYQNDYWDYLKNADLIDRYYKTPGWNNKMFVRAELMPHQIRITDIKVERLQDISHEDCLKEGVFMLEDPFYPDRKGDFVYVGATGHYKTPKVAFAYLIDKISGKGTWDSNPYVFAYNFELVK